MSDPRLAAGIIEAVDTRFRQLEKSRPYTAYGTVASVSTTPRTCSVYIEGDPAASIGFRYGQVQPGVGQRVRVVIDPRGDRYVDDSYGETTSTKLRVGQGQYIEQYDNNAVIALLTASRGASSLRAKGITVAGSYAAPLPPTDGIQLGVDGPTIQRTGAGGVNLPMGQLAYAERTTDQTGMTVDTDLTGLSVTIASMPANRRIKITGYCLVSTNAVGGQATLRIFHGATNIQSGRVTHGGTGFVAAHVAIVHTPPSGSQTYKLRLGPSSGSTSANMLAATTFPAFILVEDIGAA